MNVLFASITNIHAIAITSNLVYYLLSTSSSWRCRTQVSWRVQLRLPKELVRNENCMDFSPMKKESGEW